MIRHLVFFNLKAEVDSVDRQRLFGQIAGLANIPCVKRMMIGKLLEPHEEWYKPRLTSDYAWSITMEFEDEDALYEYQQDPNHVTIAQAIRERASGVKVFDFVSMGR